MPDSNSTVTQADIDVTNAILGSPTMRGAVQLAARHRQSNSNAGGVEPWPGCYADLQRRRVTTLAKLGLMLSVMASGEAADLYAEVLMALGIEDADDTDIALEEARDHPDSDIMAVQAKFEALASLSTPTAEREAGEADEHYTVAMERRPKEIGGVKVGPGLYRIHWKDGGSSLAAIGMCRNGAWWVAPTNWVEPAVAFRIDEDPEGHWSWAGVKALERLEPPALTTPPTPDSIGKDAVREALAGLVKWADNIMRAHSVTAPQKAVERARRALSSHKGAGE